MLVPKAVIGPKGALKASDIRAFIHGVTRGLDIFNPKLVKFFKFLLRDNNSFFFVVNLGAVWTDFVIEVVGSGGEVCFLTVQSPFPSRDSLSGT